MTKKELTKSLSDKTTLNQKEAAQALEALTNIIAEKVRQGEKVSLNGFGTFSLRYRQERTAYNPFTKKIMIKSAHKVPVFKSYKQFKESVNQ